MEEEMGKQDPRDRIRPEVERNEGKGTGFWASWKLGLEDGRDQERAARMREVRALRRERRRLRGRVRKLEERVRELEEMLRDGSIGG